MGVDIEAIDERTLFMVSLSLDNSCILISRQFKMLGEILDV